MKLVPPCAGRLLLRYRLVTKIGYSQESLAYLKREIYGLVIIQEEMRIHSRARTD
jgi:hypothetical protein